MLDLTIPKVSVSLFKKTLEFIRNVTCPMDIPFLSIRKVMRQNGQEFTQRQLSSKHWSKAQRHLKVNLSLIKLSFRRNASFSFETQAVKLLQHPHFGTACISVKNLSAYTGFALPTNVPALAQQRQCSLDLWICITSLDIQILFIYGQELATSPRSQYTRALDLNTITVT